MELHNLSLWVWGIVSYFLRKVSKFTEFLLRLVVKSVNPCNFYDDLKKIPIIVITSKDLTEEDYSFLTTSVDQVIQKGKYTRKELIGRIDTAIKASNLKTYQKGNLDENITG